RRTPLPALRGRGRCEPPPPDPPRTGGGEGAGPPDSGPGSFPQLELLAQLRNPDVGSDALLQSIAQRLGRRELAMDQEDPTRRRIEPRDPGDQLVLIGMGAEALK